MKKIKFFMLAMMTAITSMTFVACNDDDPVINPQNPAENEYNFNKYQAAVNAVVAANHKHEKAILLVAFGSTWQQAYDAFDETVAAYKKKFTDCDVFLAFSSAICINRAAQGENVAPRYFYAPNFWLTAFAQKGVQYKEITVQSLQVIPGEEYAYVMKYMKDFQNNSQGDIDDNYLKNVKVKLGVPLMADPDKDVPVLARHLHSAMAQTYKVPAGSSILFMGHGNPDAFDTFKANVRYTQLEEALQSIDGANYNYYVGTVDMMENFKTHVYERMQHNGVVNGKVYCFPLMSIAGDHAHNDMSGDDDAWDEDSESFEINDEGEVEDTSWKCFFSHKNYECNDETQIVHGLLEIPAVRDMWMQHTEEAEDFDYYHSMYPEED